MKKIIKFKLICFLTILHLITSCRIQDYTTFEELDKHEPILIVIGEISIEEPVILFISKGRTVLELITTRNNAKLYANNDIDIEALMFKKNVYLRGSNALIFDKKHFIEYSNLGDIFTSNQEKLRDDVFITNFSTECFLFTIMDYRYYIRTQTHHDSYSLNVTPEWAMVKVAFPKACED